MTNSFHFVINLHDFAESELGNLKHTSDLWIGFFG